MTSALREQVEVVVALTYAALWLAGFTLYQLARAIRGAMVKRRGVCADQRVRG